MTRLILAPFRDAVNDNPAFCIALLILAALACACTAWIAVLDRRGTRL